MDELLSSSESDSSDKSLINLRPELDFDEVSADGNSTDESLDDKDNRMKRPNRFNGVSMTSNFQQNQFF